MSGWQLQKYLVVVGVKKRVVIKAKTAKFYQMLLQRLWQAFEEESKAGKIVFDFDEEKRTIILDLNGSKEEVEKWTATGLKDRAAMRLMRPICDIKISGVD